MSTESQNSSTGAIHDQWYDPSLQFFARMINAALIDCKCCLAIAKQSTHGALVATHLRGASPDARPTDDALLARDWIAGSVTPADSKQRRFMSFAQCCEMLGVDWERSRANMLAVIDTAGSFTTVVQGFHTESGARLAALRRADLPDDAEPLFDAPRIVPVVDQISLNFSSEE